MLKSILGTSSVGAALEVTGHRPLSARRIFYNKQGKLRVEVSVSSFRAVRPHWRRHSCDDTGSKNEERNESGFSGTSFQSVNRKVSRFRLPNVNLVEGFFSESFQTLLLEPKFCIAHLDVNLYESYRECLQFFYPRIVLIGIVLVDECNDPP